MKFHFYKIKFLLLTGFLCAAVSFATAQTPDNKNVLPDTQLGKIVTELLAVINEGDEKAIKTFVESKFSAAAIKNQTEDGLITLLNNLKRQSGGIEIIRVTPDIGESPMYLTIKSKKENRFARVTIGLNRAENKLAGIGIGKIENPEARIWAQNKLSESAMIAEIKRQIEQRAKNGDFSGAVLIGKGDKILLNEIYGYADREAKIPNTIKTQFHLASVGKMFTSAAIAVLVKAGKLSYTDPVGKHLPDFPNREIAEKVTIHQLLTHSAGLGTFFESPGFDRKRQYRTAAEEITVYKDEKLFFEPGAKWRYSNAGYSLLAAIIERVSGKSYLEFLRENIFKPLGMKNTDTNSFEVPAINAAILYSPTDADPFGLESYRADRSILRSPATGFGGGFSTAADLFKFARSYRTGKLLGKELTEIIVTPKVTETSTRKWGYGIAQSELNGETVLGHNGGGRAAVQILWNSGFTVIVLTNVTPPTADSLAGKITDFITRQNNF